MIKAKHLMSTNLITVDPEETVDEVMGHMIKHEISGLPVVDMSGQLLGIITEFDLIDLVWKPDVEKNMVYHYMTRDVYRVDEDAELSAVAMLFRGLSVRRLIVMRGDEVVGVLSRRDLIRYVLKSRSRIATSEEAVR